MRICIIVWRVIIVTTTEVFSVKIKVCIAEVGIEAVSVVLCTTGIES